MKRKQVLGNSLGDKQGPLLTEEGTNLVDKIHSIKIHRVSREEMVKGGTLVQTPKRNSNIHTQHYENKLKRPHPCHHRDHHFNKGNRGRKIVQ